MGTWSSVVLVFLSSLCLASSALSVDLVSVLMALIVVSKLSSLLLTRAALWLVLVSSDVHPADAPGQG